MTSAYQELTSKYEEILKKIGNGIDRSLYFNIVFAALWGLLAFSRNDIASRYSLHASLAILVMAIWRFYYFFPERKLDTELSEIILDGVKYEKNHPQKKSFFFTKALKDFRRIPKIVTRIMFLFFLMMSFKMAFFNYWVKLNYPDHLKMAVLYFKPISWAYYIWFGWLIVKPFQKIKNYQTALKESAA